MSEDILYSLHPLERKILPSLKTCTTADQVIQKTKLKQVEVIRALQWLEEKQILRLKQEQKEFYTPTTTGQNVIKQGLPEKRFLNALPSTLNKLKEILSREEMNISLGMLKKAGAITLKPEIKQLPNAENILKDNKIEDFLTSLPKQAKQLDKNLTNQLLRRGLIKKETLKHYQVELTSLGKQLAEKEIRQELIEELTPKLLQTRQFKDKKFRIYNLESPVKKLYPGKRHFVNQAVRYAKRIWLDMGFKEMTGNLIQSAFWNFDVLFVPQDHPAREMQDTFFLNQKSQLPSKKLVRNVKQAHEKGIAGSKGWKYQWSEKEAQRTVLRTHTTGISAQILANLNLKDLPQKYFAIGRNFRNEALDWAHLFEFNQTEGIVVDENATFRDLLGYLKQFFKKMGYEKARFRPGYFPYTEPSCEIEVYHPIKKTWIELGGAGVFRPELVVPLLGKNIPVLAWGLGLGRMIALNYDIKDIRESYKNDLKQLREIKCQL